MMKSEIELKVRDLIIIAEQRTCLQIDFKESVINDILSEFKNVSLNDIQRAFRLGGLGKYGRTYKLSTQELCFWIRQYLESKNKNRVAL